MHFSSALSWIFILYKLVAKIVSIHRGIWNGNFEPSLNVFTECALLWKTFIDQPFFLYIALTTNEFMLELHVLVLYVFVSYGLNYVCLRWYRCDVDPFISLLSSFAYVAACHIYYKVNWMPVVPWLILYILIHLCSVWICQFCLYYFYSDQIVLVHVNTPISGDSGGHFIAVKVGNNSSGQLEQGAANKQRTWEIFKEDGSLSARPIPKENRQIEIGGVMNFFWIPFTQYGIIGISRKSSTDLSETFNSLCKEYKEKYNFSYQSCQEIALRMAAAATKDDACLGFSLSNFKGLLLVLSTYGFLFLVLVCMNVNIEVSYKNDITTPVQLSYTENQTTTKTLN